jgi:hypothetical protein
MKTIFLLFLSLAAFPAPTWAGSKSANPGNYRAVISSLKAGDTLTLEAGIYERGLPLSDCQGAAEAWITIQGPAHGVAEIRQSASANCVELFQCQFVALKSLTIQGQGVQGQFGISAKGGLKNSVHHILVEDCTISDFNTSQQAVGISTKTPTWDWVIRRNIIRNCGTGLYLGNSNGEDPFINGVIEYNLVHDTNGYCMQIKFQNSRPNISGLPTTPSRTLIRHNVFIKNNTPSPDGDRPNLLVGGFPNSGPGSKDVYEIYGNFFFHNSRESLLHASGRVIVHDNVFADCPDAQYAAITLSEHDLPLKLAQVYHNTIIASARGIRMTVAPSEGHAVLGNVIFADQPLVLHPGVKFVAENLTGPINTAADHLIQPMINLGEMDLHPKAGQCQGPPVELASIQKRVDFDVDFDGRDKGPRTHRGAYATSGGEPAWVLQQARKEP